MLLDIGRWLLNELEEADAIPTNLDLFTFLKFRHLIKITHIHRSHVDSHPVDINR